MIPVQRLTAADLYHFIDWLKEAFDRHDDVRLVISPQISRLEHTLYKIPDPHRTQALELMGQVKRACLSRTAAAELAGTFVRLRGVVSAWDRSR